MGAVAEWSKALLKIEKINENLKDPWFATHPPGLGTLKKPGNYFSVTEDKQLRAKMADMEDAYQPNRFGPQTKLYNTVGGSSSRLVLGAA